MPAEETVPPPYAIADTPVAQAAEDTSAPNADEAFKDFKPEDAEPQVEEEAAVDADSVFAKLKDLKPETSAEE